MSSYRNCNQASSIQDIFSFTVTMAKHTIVVVKEIHKGCWIFQSSAAATPEQFWTAVLQCGAWITTAGLQVWECP